MADPSTPNSESTLSAPRARLAGNRGDDDDRYSKPTYESVADAARMADDTIRSRTQALRYFAAYRLVLASVIGMLAMAGIAPPNSFSSDSQMFYWVAGLYFSVSVLELFYSWSQVNHFALQMSLQFVLDLLFLTLLMHSAGGVTSGYGVLIVVSVAGAGVLSGGRNALSFAALAALCILTEEVYVDVGRTFWSPDYLHAGLLGAASFTAAALAYVSARWVRQSEALAARRGIDLANLSALNEHIIQRMQAGVIAVDPSGAIRFMNESATRLLAHAGKSSGIVLTGVDPRLRELLSEWQSNRNQPSYFFSPTVRDLQLVASFAALGPAAQDGTLIFLEDASATTQQAQQLKLASLGRLAGSIAHEIRNPLGAITHASQLMLESQSLDEGDRRLLRIVLDNGQRMNRMVENVLELGRGRTAELERVELSDWLERFVADFRVQRELDEEEVRLDVEVESLVVNVDPEQLHQVVWNLCENAMQHIQQDKRLQLRAGVSAETGRPVLDVIDNGPGIPIEERDRIFEPFFTTRNQGTGLGLYIAREICEGNRASLSLADSESGARFRITFADPRRRDAVKLH